MVDLRGVTIGQILTLLGYDGTAFRNVTVDASGHLQVDVLTTGISSTAATKANQVLEIAQLTLIATLTGALGAVATDKLRASVLDSALPTGASTSAKQDTMITALQLIDNLVGALNSVNTDKLLASITDSALPAGASTSARQDTQTTSLQMIDNLVGALLSVNTDKLLVRGKDQLFSYKDKLISTRTATISGANGYVESSAPPAGEVWCVQRVSAKDATTATTAHSLRHNSGGTIVTFDDRIAALALNVFSHGAEIVYLEAGDVVRVAFTGGAAADLCTVTLVGNTMTKE